MLENKINVDNVLLSELIRVPYDLLIQFFSARKPDDDPFKETEMRLWENNFPFPVIMTRWKSFIFASRRSSISHIGCRSAYD